MLNLNVVKYQRLQIVTLLSIVTSWRKHKKRERFYLKGAKHI